jgi:hypothetical protein
MFKKFWTAKVRHFPSKTRNFLQNRGKTSQKQSQLIINDLGEMWCFSFLEDLGPGANTLPQRRNAFTTESQFVHRRVAKAQRLIGTDTCSASETDETTTACPLRLKKKMPTTLRFPL